MRMVSAVVNYKQPRRGIRVAQYSIEVDHPVIRAAHANPRVDRLALDLVRGRKDRKRSSRDKKPFKGSQGAAVDFESSRMRAPDELFMTLNDLIGGDLFRGNQSPRPPDADVVAPQVHDHVRYPRLGQRVAIKPTQAVCPEEVMKESVTDHSFVQYAHLLIARLSHQPAGEFVRPTVVGIRGRLRAGRYRGADGHNCPGL